MQLIPKKLKSKLSRVFKIHLELNQEFGRGLLERTRTFKSHRRLGKKACSASGGGAREAVSGQGLKWFCSGRCRRGGGGAGPPDTIPRNGTGVRRPQLLGGEPDVSLEGHQNTPPWDAPAEGH